MLVCEDCLVKSYADRGDTLPFRKFHSEHIGHNAHVNNFGEEGKICMQLTNQLKRGTPEEYRRIDPEEFLKLLAEMTCRVFGALEWISLDDKRYARKKVVITTFPRIALGEIKKKKAYFVLLTEPKKCRFKEIDMNIPQIGIVKGWFGQELALVIVAKRKIHVLPAKKLEEITSEIEQEFQSRWNLVVGEC